MTLPALLYRQASPEVSSRQGFSRSRRVAVLYRQVQPPSSCVPGRVSLHSSPSQPPQLLGCGHISLLGRCARGDLFESLSALLPFLFLSVVISVSLSPFTWMRLVSLGVPALVCRLAPFPRAFIGWPVMCPGLMCRGRFGGSFSPVVLADPVCVLRLLRRSCPSAVAPSSRPFRRRLHVAPFGTSSVDSTL